ncbi:MAG: virulence RhuM family protein, partial [Fidelibacterota bacterium]
MNGTIEIYQGPDGTHIEVQFEEETIWLSQLQMAELFDKDVRTINEHIQTIFKTNELVRDGTTIRKFRIVRQEGKREVTRNIDHFNLDMIISVGYRVNSKRGTQFRIWATKRLKHYLVQGYAINEKRLEQKEMQVEQLKT